MDHDLSCVILSGHPPSLMKPFMQTELVFSCNFSQKLYMYVLKFLKFCPENRRRISIIFSAAECLKLTFSKIHRHLYSLPYLFIKMSWLHAHCTYYYRIF